MWTTNGCTTRSPRRGGAPDRKTRRSRRPKGDWPPTSKPLKPTSSARDAPGHDLAPSPVARDAGGGGASHPASRRPGHAAAAQGRAGADARQAGALEAADSDPGAPQLRDRKSTRLNSSHITISYAVFCLKKKKKENRSSKSE